MSIPGLTSEEEEELRPHDGTILASGLKAVRDEKPNQFTVGGVRSADGSIVGGVTYDRAWRNGWGAAGFAKAWWSGSAIHLHPTGAEVGVEITKKF